MRAAKILAVLAIAALGIGVFTGVALAGKKKKTIVQFFTSSPKVNKGGQVTAKGDLDSTAKACRPSRSMKLFVTDSTGVILATLDGSTTDSSGNWKLQGHLPANLPAGSHSIEVKAQKRTVGKFVCRAGFSPLVPIQQ
jgi:hypothetical protein